MRRLSGKIALVTGGSRSIGAAIARRLALEGASVAITYFSSPQNADVLVAEISASGGNAFAIRADAGDPPAVRDSVAQTIGKFGAIDILVNNAGIIINRPVEDYEYADYERMIAVNVTGMFVATQEAVRRMSPGGRVINIGSSMSRYAGFAKCSVYTLTKGAIAGFSRSLARDLGPREITVNTLLVGPTNTDMNPKDGPYAPMVGPYIAVGRYGEPPDVAGAVAFLASPDAAFITAAELMVDGGYTA